MTQPSREGLRAAREEFADCYSRARYGWRLQDFDAAKQRIVRDRAARLLALNARAGEVPCQTCDGRGWESASGLDPTETEFKDRRTCRDCGGRDAAQPEPLREALDVLESQAFPIECRSDAARYVSIEQVRAALSESGDKALAATPPTERCSDSSCRATFPHYHDEFEGHIVRTTPPTEGLDPMCPNCVTPWKCNGPHIPESSPEPLREALDVERVTRDMAAAMPWYDDANPDYSEAVAVLRAALSEPHDKPPSRDVRPSEEG